MKAFGVIFVYIAILCSVTRAADQESKRPNDKADRGFIGIRLDRGALPDILTKHLHLKPGQGLRIQNIHKGGPSDKAGLERDDLIIQFEGLDVNDFERFVNAIGQRGVDAKIHLEVIHLGQRRPVEVTLSRHPDDFDSKYPSEPTSKRTWRPGKILRFDPDKDQWVEISSDGVRGQQDGSIKELRIISYGEGKDRCSVTIEGDPNSQDARLSIRTGNTEYMTTVREIDKLPAGFREQVNRALKDARQEARQRTYDQVHDPRQQDLKDMVAEHPQAEPETESLQKTLDNLKAYFENLDKSRPVPEGDRERLERIEQQLRDVQKRLDQLGYGQKT